MHRGGVRAWQGEHLHAPAPAPAPDAIGVRGVILGTGSDGSPHPILGAALAVRGINATAPSTGRSGAYNRCEPVGGAGVTEQNEELSARQDQMQRSQAWSKNSRKRSKWQVTGLMVHPLCSASRAHISHPPHFHHASVSHSPAPQDPGAWDLHPGGHRTWVHTCRCAGEGNVAGAWNRHGGGMHEARSAARHKVQQGVDAESEGHECQD